MQVAYTDLKPDETHMLQKFYTMLQKTDLKSFKLKVSMISAKTGAAIQNVDGADGAPAGPAASDVFQSTVPSQQPAVTGPEPQEEKKSQAFEKAPDFNQN